RETAGHDLDLLIEGGGDTVNAADEGALPAADHSHSKLPLPALHDASPQANPSIARFASASLPAPAKSSNATVVGSIRCFRMNGAPSRAPCSGLFTQHSHSSTAQPSKPMLVMSENTRLKSTWPSPSERKRPARLPHGWSPP